MAIIGEREEFRATVACGRMVRTTCALVNVGSVMVCPVHGEERVTSVAEPCIHPGVFARPGVPMEHCWSCDTDVPAEKL